MFHVKRLERELFLFGFHFRLELSIASINGVTDCLEHGLHLLFGVLVVAGRAVAQDVQLVNDTVDTRACNADKLLVLALVSGMMVLVFAIVVYLPFQ